MIIDMPNTRTSAIASRIEQLQEERGESTTGRVLTLLIKTDETELESSVEVANVVGREHPCRVIAIVPNERPDEHCEQSSNLDAQVRFGADAGAGEVIILRPRGGLIEHLDTLVIPLLVADTPIVVWWPTNPPADPAQDLLGAMASSRITDAQRSADPCATLRELREHWTDVDVDLSWTRLTVWRAMLAALLDQPPHEPITGATVRAPRGFLPGVLMRAWLEQRLHVPTRLEYQDDAEAVTSVQLARADGGVIAIDRPHANQAVIRLSGQPAQPIIMPIRSLEDCMSEELRRMNPDAVYADIMLRGDLQ